MAVLSETQRMEKIEALISYQFRDRAWLRDALTHSSAGLSRNYERLEFLGDRVLNLIMAQALFERFPGEAEGDLAKRHAALVQGRMLAQIARQLELGALIQLSEAERGAGGAENDNILADSVEAILGALYLDGGLLECDRVVRNLWGDSIHVLIRPPRDPKTALQEWAQGRGLPLPVYEAVGRDGPDHAPIFEVEVSVEGAPPTRAKGASLRKAEKEAAAMLLTHLEEMFG